MGWPHCTNPDLPYSGQLILVEQLRGDRARPSIEGRVDGGRGIKADREGGGGGRVRGRMGVLECSVPRLDDRPLP